MEIEFDMSEMGAEAPKKVTGARPGSVIDEKVTAEIWVDSVTPIVSRGSRHDVYMYTEVFAPAEYAKLVHLLGMVGADDMVVLHINTGGGMLDSCELIMNAIHECDAIVIGKLSGTVASAGTMIALACDELEISPHCHWLSHMYSGNVAGKGSDMKAEQAFMDTEIEKMYYEIHRGFFTEEEIASLVDGKDRWLNKDQVVERLAARELYRDGKGTNE